MSDPDGRLRLPASPIFGPELDAVASEQLYAVQSDSRLAGFTTVSLEDTAGHRGPRPPAFDLRLAKLFMLMGRPAPELRDVRGWIDTAPLRVGDQRGQFFVLFLLGFWCDSCKPDLAELCLRAPWFADNGVVFLSIHDKTVGTVQELRTKLAELRNQEWAGKEFLVPVALDTGSIIDDYGVHRFPTILLIGPSGVLLGKYATVDALEVELRARLRKPPPRFDPPRPDHQ